MRRLFPRSNHHDRIGMCDPRDGRADPDMHRARDEQTTLAHRIEEMRS